MFEARLCCNSKILLSLSTVVRKKFCFSELCRTIYLVNMMLLQVLGLSRLLICISCWSCTCEVALAMLFTFNFGLIPRAFFISDSTESMLSCYASLNTSYGFLPCRWYLTKVEDFLVLKSLVVALGTDPAPPVTTKALAILVPAWVCTWLSETCSGFPSLLKLNSELFNALLNFIY